MKPKKLLAIRKTEKDPFVRDRIMLNVLVIRDKMSISEAARHLGMVPSWGVKWRQRYVKEGVDGMQTRSRSGRPPRVCPVRYYHCFSEIPLQSLEVGDKDGSVELVVRPKELSAVHPS